MKSDIRWKLHFSQIFTALVTIGALYVYLWFSVGIAGKGLHIAFAIALAAAVCTSLLFSYFFFNDSYRSLLIMARIATRIGKGEFEDRAPVSSDDAVGELAGVMNVMSSRIASRIENLAAEKNRLNAILLGMGEGLLVTDAKGSVTFVNPAFRELFSLHDEVEGKPLSAITRLPALHEAFREVVETRKEKAGEFTFPLHEERTLQTH